MGRAIRILVEFTLTIIGIGGLKGDLKGWAEWLKMDNPNIGWGLLTAVCVILLVLNLVPHRTWVRTHEHLPKWLRRLLAIIINIRPESDKVSAFYTTRNEVVPEIWTGC